MRGKPIDQITAEDIYQLIADGAAEGPHLEFKEDIPVSEEQQREHQKRGQAGRPRDRSWTLGKPLPGHGRDALAEEVVAFANADGGVIVLGMKETVEAPPRASALNPLPDVAGLERRLRDTLIDTIEPRLPYIAVRGIPTDDDGSGVVVIETSHSLAGPHWAKRSRKPTIRRDDRCDPLSMTEIHEMVRRLARSMDEVGRSLEAERGAFLELFRAHLGRQKPDNFVDADPNKAVAMWLRQGGKAAVGAQVTLVPHFDLGIPRLESLEGLLPAGNAIGVSQNAANRSTNWLSHYSFIQGANQKILGGVVAKESGVFENSVRIMRDGRIVVSAMRVADPMSCTCSADFVVTLAGFVLGAFDRLRSRTNYPAAPADLTLDICTREHVGVGYFEGFGNQSSFGRLAEHTSFPTWTLGDRQDIQTLLQEIASDLMNAGGNSASTIQQLTWQDPHGEH